MPIRIKCQCGKALSVKDEFAGKAVKCPGCGKGLKVPAGGAAAASQRPAAKRPAPKPAAPAAPVAPLGELGDLFAEEGFDRHVAAVCPSCSAEMAGNAVLCTKCGYNKQTGESLQRHQTAGVDIDHGTLALMKAEDDLVKDKKLQDEMLGKSGMPPWMLALILFILVSGTTIAVLAVNAASRLEGEFNVNPLALFLALCAGAFYLVSLGSNLLVIVHAFKQNVVTGLMVMFIPFYIFVHAVKNWSEIGMKLVVAIICGMISGGFMAGAMAAGLQGVGG